MAGEFQFLLFVTIASLGWETKYFRYSPELGSLLYILYKIPLAQACFPLAQANFYSHWQAGKR